MPACHIGTQFSKWLRCSSVHQKMCKVDWLKRLCFPPSFPEKMSHVIQLPGVKCLATESNLKNSNIVMDKLFPVPCLWDQTATSLPTDQIWLIAQFLFPLWFVWFHVHFELKLELVHKQYQVSLSQINTALLIFTVAILMTPLDHDVILLVYQYFACPLSVLPVSVLSIHHQLKQQKCHCNDLVNHVLKDNLFVGSLTILWNLIRPWILFPNSLFTLLCTQVRSIQEKCNLNTSAMPESWKYGLELISCGAKIMDYRMYSWKLWNNANFVVWCMNV